MPESFIPVWMSLGEAQVALAAACENCGREAPMPESLWSAIEDALEEERPRSFEEMERERPGWCRDG